MFSWVAQCLVLVDGCVRSEPFPLQQGSHGCLRVSLVSLAAFLCTECRSSLSARRITRMVCLVVLGGTPEFLKEEILL